MNNLSYTELLRIVPLYQEQRGDTFIAEVPTFISLAENRIAAEMKQQGFQVTVTSTLPTDGVMEKPAWWRETISFSYTNAAGKRIPLFPRTVQYCQNYWPDSSETGQPKFYADYNVSNYLIVPTPVSAFECELLYYARLEPLSAANDSNWMTLNAPHALFYAVMMEANIFLKNKAKLDEWTALYTGARDGMLSENKERITDKASIVTRP